VEQSGGGVRRCPAAGCTRAVEFVGCAGDVVDDGADVFCE
jgi:ariadne-1